MKYYLKYNFKYSDLYDVINKNKYKKVNFFLDLPSICTGFYNKDVILMEVGRYASEGKISDILLLEFREYLRNLYDRFKQYDPYFITFFDDGRCLQNRTILKEYKEASSLDNVQLEMENIQLFRSIKKYYYDKIHTIYNNHKAASTFYLKEYEADLIPFVCLHENLFDSREPDVSNFILSKDKDLLQCLQFTNTYQVTSNFKKIQNKNTSSASGKSSKENFTRLWDDQTAIEYIYPNFKRGFLSSKHIPLILSITGDKSDGISGIDGIGPAKAIKLIQDYKIPHTLEGLKKEKKLPDILNKNIDMVIKNMMLIDFSEQMKRIPKHVFSH